MRKHPALFLCLFLCLLLGRGGPQRGLWRGGGPVPPPVPCGPQRRIAAGFGAPSDPVAWLRDKQFLDTREHPPTAPHAMVSRPDVGFARI